MRDVLLFAAVVGFMILGFFIVGKADKFFTENYKGFEDDEDDEDKDQDTEDSVQKGRK